MRRFASLVRRHKLIRVGDWITLA